jgi:hypothetical protein
MMRGYGPGGVSQHCLGPDSRQADPSDLGYVAFFIVRLSIVTSSGSPPWSIKLCRKTDLLLALALAVTLAREAISCLRINTRLRGEIRQARVVALCLRHHSAHHDTKLDNLPIVTL